MPTLAASRLSAVEHVILWWEDHLQGQGIPKRAVFGSAGVRCALSDALQTALPDLFLVDAELDAAAGKRLYRCQLTGADFDHMLGVNLTTPCAPDLPLPFEIQAIIGEFDKAVSTRRPRRGNHCIERPNDRHFEYDWAIAPLAYDAGNEITSLIGAIDFKCIFDLPSGRPPGCPGREVCQKMALCDLPAGCGLRI